MGFWLFAVLCGLKIVVQLQCNPAKKRNIKPECDFQPQMILNFTYINFVFKIKLTHFPQHKLNLIDYSEYGSGFESLKTKIERISYYIHQMHGMHSFFQN